MKSNLIKVFSKQSLGRLAFVLLLSELVLILMSWILSATGMEGIRSLLSSEGIRWFVGGFTEMISSPILVWIILMLIALGAFMESGILSLMHIDYHMTYREKTAMRVAVAILVVYALVVLLLTVSPHAILLSVVGSLFPSPFSRSIVPLISFAVCLVSVACGIVSGRQKTLADILDSMSYGIRLGAPIFIIYILVIQFLRSIRFVII